MIREIPKGVPGPTSTPENYQHLQDLTPARLMQEAKWALEGNDAALIEIYKDALETHTSIDNWQSDDESVNQLASEISELRAQLAQRGTELRSDAMAQQIADMDTQSQPVQPKATDRYRGWPFGARDKK